MSSMHTEEQYVDGIAIALAEAPPIMPFYLVFDESFSMATYMPVLNQELEALRDEVKRNAQLKDLAHVSVITFAETAQCRMDMQPVSAEMPVPTLSPRSSTNYGSVFEYLTDCIPADVAAIKHDARERGIDKQVVLRPAVFFISDGEPTDGDGWKAVRSALLELRVRPNIAAFGFGQVNAATIRAVATDNCAFSAEQGIPPVVVLKEFLSAIIGSIISSALSTPTGRPQLTIEPPKHALQLDAEPV